MEPDSTRETEGKDVIQQSQVASGKLPTKCDAKNLPLQHWKKVVRSSSLEVSKTQVNRALSNLISLQSQPFSAKHWKR